jgi:hypothetical protein
MSNIKLHKSIENIVKKISESDDYNFFVIRMKLINPETGYEIYIGSPLRIDIIRDLESNIMDYIEVDFKMYLKDYINACNEYENLYSIIEFRKCDSDLNVDNKPYKTLKSKIIFKDKVDLLKVISKERIYGRNGIQETDEQMANEINISAQLIDPKEYIVRKIQLNGLYSSNIENIILMAHSIFGISKYKLALPDNTRFYNNLYIPSTRDITNLFFYLQSVYGIYRKDITYYILNDCLYIYPRYEISMNKVWDINSTVHIYSVDEQSYLGGKNYHTYIENDLHIINNSPVVNNDPQASNVENIANTLLITSKEEILDKKSSLNNDKKNVDIKNTVKLMELNDIQSLDGENTLSVKYANSYGNPYIYESLMYSLQNIATSLMWYSADPFLEIEPGTQVKYHYEDEDKYKTVDATFRRIDYSIIKVKVNGDGINDIFQCVATLHMYTGR